MQCSKDGDASLDRLVGAGGEAKRLGGFEVDNQFEFCRLLHR